MAAFPPYFRIGCAPEGEARERAAGQFRSGKLLCLKCVANKKLTLFLERRLTAIWLLVDQ
jgi:hypothetical protein